MSIQSNALYSNNRSVNVPIFVAVIAVRGSNYNMDIGGQIWDLSVNEK